MAEAIQRDQIQDEPAFPAKWSLVRQFAVTGGLIMLVAMLIAGHLSSRIVTDTTIENTAAASALLVGNLIAPVVQNLDIQDSLSDVAIYELDQMTGQGAFAERFPHVEIWKEGGLVVYSRSPELIGRTFDPPEGLVQALRGEVSAAYTDLEAGEHVARLFTDSFLEIYVPIRRSGSGEIIAVAEIHEVTGPLDKRLWTVQSQSWLSVVTATALVMCGLIGVIYRASRVIDRQQTDLRRQIVEIERVSAMNRQLKDKAQRAASRVAELTESNLRRIGADLHDGPAQLVGYSSLMVEHVRRARSTSQREEHLGNIEVALNDALQEIRTISKGLLSPEIEHLALDEIVERVVRIYQQRTNAGVRVEVGEIGGELTPAAKLCVFRFVQEGLNNAYRHARPDGHLVRFSNCAGVLKVAVHDRGTPRGADVPQVPGLGLTGLRERVESLGGTLRLDRSPEGGIMLEMTLSTIGGGV